MSICVMGTVLDGNGLRAGGGLNERRTVAIGLDGRNAGAPALSTARNATRRDGLLAASFLAPAAGE
jgi:hypothetical protein